MRRRKGFTLIELLVAIAIIAILAAILFPTMYRAKQAAWQSTCQSNLRQIGAAFKMYSHDYDGAFPTNQAGRGYPYDPDVMLSGSSYHSPCNYVEAVSQYGESLSDIRSRETVWRCRTASDEYWPAITRWKEAAVTYSLNYYVAGRCESSLDDVANTLLMRETDRLVHAALRPCPSTPPSAQSPEGGSPRWAFPTTDNDAGAFAMSKVIPNRHFEGSSVLLADGHVKHYRSNELSGSPALVGSQWKVGSICITP
jgi:prepilin-type N-terminal cleavage/methylation domain-containing protein